MSHIARWANQEATRILSLERAQQLLAGVAIPPRPSILVELLQEKSRPEVSLRRIADMLSKDVALSAATIKIVNSPFFGLVQKTGSIQHAVNLLGATNVINVVTGLMLRSAFRDAGSTLMETFWATSQQIAMITTYIGRHVLRLPPDEAYAVGLFCDCGVPVLVRRFPQYKALYARHYQALDQPIHYIEEAEIETDHTVAGYMMAQAWHLPPLFCEAILRHHDPINYYSDETSAGEVTPVLAMLMLAQQVYRTLHGMPPSFEWTQVGASVLAYLALKDTGIDHLIAEIHTLFEGGEQE